MEKYKIKINCLILGISIIVFVIGSNFIPFISGTGNKELEYIIILALPCFLLFSYSFGIQNKKLRRWILFLYLITYAIAVLSFVFSSRTSIVTVNNVILNDNNFIPFRGIFKLFSSSFGIRNAIYNVIGNLLMLTPLAILLPRLFSSFNNILKYSITIIIITIFIEVIQLIFNIGSFDVDDILLNFIGSLLFYYLCNKTRITKVLDNIFINKIYNNKIIVVVYYILLIINILMLIYYTLDIKQSYQDNQVDISKLVCRNNLETYVTSFGNYDYYTKCDYSGSYVYIGSFIPLSMEEFITSERAVKYYDDLGISKRKIITDVKILKNEDKKITLIYDEDNIQSYLVNIDNIIYTYDSDEHEISQMFSKDARVSPLAVVDIYQTNLEMEYTIYLGNYFNVVNCKDSDITKYYYLPLDYSINDTICDKFEELLNQK